MPVVDPNDPKFAKRKRYTPRGGWAVVQVVGIQAGTSGAQNKPYWHVGTVILAEIDNQPDPELDPPTDVGMLARARLYRTDAAVWRLVDLARMLGQTAPFDTDLLAGERDAEGRLAGPPGVLDILAGKPFEARIVLTEAERDGKKRTYADIEEWRPLGRAVDPAWTDVLDGGFDAWEEYLAKSAEFTARGGSRSGGGGSRGGGGGRGSSGGGSRDGARQGGAADDSIPF